MFCLSWRQRICTIEVLFDESNTPINVPNTSWRRPPKGAATVPNHMFCALPQNSTRGHHDPLCNPIRSCLLGIKLLGFHLKKPHMGQIAPRRGSCTHMRSAPCVCWGLLFINSIEKGRGRLLRWRRTTLGHWPCSTGPSAAADFAVDIAPVKGLFAFSAAPFCPLPITTRMKPNEGLLRKLWPEDRRRVKRAPGRTGREPLLLLLQFHWCIRQNSRHGIGQCKAKLNLVAGGHFQARIVKESWPTTEGPKEYHYLHPDKWLSKKLTRKCT